MKDQYFGDARDYFKYDLLESLMAGLPGLEQLTCVWMLTPDDGTAHGGTPFVPHPNLPRLNEFLTPRWAAGLGRKHIWELRDYFAGQRFRYCPYRDDPYRDKPPYFGGSSRRAYFEGIPDETLRRALVFFDPDTGMEPPSGRFTSAHLRFAELAQVFDRMDRESLAGVFQWKPRVAGFCLRMCERLQAALESQAAYIVEGNLGFYVIPRDPQAMPAIGQVLTQICRRGKSRFFSVCPG